MVDATDGADSSFASTGSGMSGIPATGTATPLFSLFSTVKSSFFAGESPILRFSMAEAACRCVRQSASFRDCGSGKSMTYLFRGCDLSSHCNCSARSCYERLKVMFKSKKNVGWCARRLLCDGGCCEWENRGLRSQGALAAQNARTRLT